MVAALRRGEEELVDAVMPVQPCGDVSVQAQVERMRDAPGDLLLDDLGRIYGDRLPRSWWPAADRPRAWFESLARATAQGFAAIEHTWRSAVPAIDREIQRVGVACVRGGLDVVLNSLHPHLRFRNGVLWLDAGTDRCVRLDGRRLALVPVIGSSGALLANFDLPGLAYVAYHVPWRDYPWRGDTAGALATALNCGATVLGLNRVGVMGGGILGQLGDRGVPAPSRAARQAMHALKQAPVSARTSAWLRSCSGSCASAAPRVLRWSPLSCGTPGPAANPGRRHAGAVLAGGPRTRASARPRSECALTSVAATSMMTRPPSRRPMTPASSRRPAS